MNPELAETILHVDALNSWVRSESFKSLWKYGGQGFKRSFYFFKKQAIKRAHEAGHVMARGIETAAKCHKCGGTGTYVNWDGVDCGPCRGCTGTGTAKLRFLETHIDVGGRTLVWHHPEGGHGGLGTSLGYYLGSVKVTDWCPNSVGRDIPTADALTAVNAVERFFLDRPTDYWGDESGDVEGPYNDFLYSWPLDFKEPDQCDLCGMTDKALLCTFQCSRFFLDWIGVACKACDVEPGTAKIFEQFDFPTHRLTPAIVEWQNRHAEFWNSKRDSREFSYWQYSYRDKKPCDKLSLTAHSPA